MQDRRVRTIEQIIFENANPPVVLEKGAVYSVEAVTDSGIILYTDAGERFMIDLQTFENGFEAVL